MSVSSVAGTNQSFPFSRKDSASLNVIDSPVDSCNLGVFVGHASDGSFSSVASQHDFAFSCHREEGTMPSSVLS